MTVETTIYTEVNSPEEPDLSGYRDLDFGELQVLSDYITKNSVPVNMTMIEAQSIVTIFSNLLNLTLHNLNLLRALNGDPEFPIPEKGSVMK